MNSHELRLSELDCVADEIHNNLAQAVRLLTSSLVFILNKIAGQIRAPAGSQSRKRVSSRLYCKLKCNRIELRSSTWRKQNVNGEQRFG